jgi:hypothetical protein
MSGNKNSGRRPGFRHSPEARERMAAAQQARWTPENRELQRSVIVKGWETRRRRTAEQAAEAGAKRPGAPRAGTEAESVTATPAEDAGGSPAA